MNQHQELRDAIRNLMKENDTEIAEDYQTTYGDGFIASLESQNEKLQAILEATA